MASTSAKRLAILLPGAIVLWMGVRWGGEALRWMEPDTPSKSIGQPGGGRLEHGKRLPARGANFRVYSDLGHLLGRTCVHGTVRDVVVAAYATLAATHPRRTWVVGETGWCDGGPFAPHRTHQSGLSVDFMAPMRSGSGRPTTLPDAPWLRWGYGVDLDPTGRAPNGDTIDLAAVSAHLKALDAAARARGLRITKVVLDPALRARLPDPPRLPWTPRRAWVRHDDHYHVDFSAP